MLWEFNVELLHYLRDELAILTPFNISGPVKGNKDDGVLEILARYLECDTYLSGTGAKKYMSDTSKFDAAGIQVEWSNHAPVTGDSVVSVMMDYADPMEIIMREKEAE